MTCGAMIHLEIPNSMQMITAECEKPDNHKSITEYEEDRYHTATVMARTVDSHPTTAEIRWRFS